MFVYWTEFSTLEGVVNHSLITGTPYLKSKSQKPPLILPCHILEFGLNCSSLCNKQSLLSVSVTFIIATTGMPAGQKDLTCFLV